MRLRASKRKWWLHLGQTWRLASRSALKRGWWQEPHLIQRPSVRTVFSASLTILWSSRLNQLIAMFPLGRRAAVVPLFIVAVRRGSVGLGSGLVAGVVGVAGEDGEGAVDLLGENGAGELVG